MMNTIRGFFVHWKTSLCGIAAGALQAYAGGKTLPNVLLTAAITFLGLFASDGSSSATPPTQGQGQQ